MADSVIRVQRTSGYTVLPNGILRDPGLSLKTKGLFAIILSLPEDWDYSVTGLAAVANCGRDAIRTALGEMEQAGYLSRSRAHGENGKFTGMVYTIRDQAEPLLENPTVADDAPLSGFPTLAEPTSVDPSSENPTQLNKDIQSKDLINPHSPPQGDKPEEKKKQRRPKSVPQWKPERFEAFWAYYPRHEDRLSAVREWDRLKPSDELIDQIARALLWQTKTPDWPTPYACRYLKNQRWTDEPPRNKGQEPGRPAARQLTGWHLEIIDGEEVMVPDGDQ